MAETTPDRAVSRRGTGTDAHDERSRRRIDTGNGTNSARLISKHYALRTPKLRLRSTASSTDPTASHAAHWAAGTTEPCWAAPTAQYAASYRRHPRCVARP